MTEYRVLDQLCAHVAYTETREPLENGEMKEMILLIIHNIQNLLPCVRARYFSVKEAPHTLDYVTLQADNFLTLTF